MFNAWGHFLVRRRRAILIIFIFTTLAAGAVGSLSFSRLDSGGYSDPGSGSALAGKYLSENFHHADPPIILLIDGEGLPLKSAAVINSAARLEAQIGAESGVLRTLSYWSSGGAPALESSDHKAALLFIYTKNSDQKSVSEISKNIQDKFDGKFESLRVYVSGGGVIAQAINSKISKDLALAESISVPITFILLAFVFGALAASAMPLVVGVSAILGSFFLIYLITLFTHVSIYALNLITGLGLGLGIDYALLIVNRFREELHLGKSVEEAVVATLNSAGKTVFYSGLTVLVTMSSLILFPLPFLKSFGYAGISVVALAVASALIPLPAILAMAGKKIDKGVVRKSSITSGEDGRWASTARIVMRRPLPIVFATLGILAIFSLPITNIGFAQVDARVLPRR